MIPGSEDQHGLAAASLCQREEVGEGEEFRKTLSRRQDSGTFPGCTQPLFLLHLVARKRVSEGQEMCPKEKQSRLSGCLHRSGRKEEGRARRKCPVSEKGGVSDHEEPRGGKASQAAPVPRQIQVVLLNWQLRVSVQANEFCRIHSQRAWGACRQDWEWPEFSWFGRASDL